MHGARRVICFCLLTAVLPTILVIIPLYLRHSVYADVTYAVAESDILEMVNGISSIFCQAHSLRMNTTFSAFQVGEEAEISTGINKNDSLYKAMSLPDDTLEYWGFYLPQGSQVNLSVCSRYDGSRILVVKGEKTLRDCGLMQPDTKISSVPHMAQGEGKLLVTFETKQNFPSTMPQPNSAEVDYEGEIAENKAAVNHIGNHEDVGAPINEVENEDRSLEMDGLRKRRHERKRHEHFLKHETVRSVEKDTRTVLQRKKRLQEYLESEKVGDIHEEALVRKKRVANGVAKQTLDGGVAHGATPNKNFTFERDNDSSVSSFENSLLDCYDGRILLTKGFPPSHLCNGKDYLLTGEHMQTIHNVVSDGYYYYIFYSDNDYRVNDIYALFNISKPTFQYGNYTNACINQTQCTFPIPFLSDDTVVVEVPTRDGIEHEADDITLLHSTCHPRMAVYAIFPITVLFLILGCAFL